MPKFHLPTVFAAVLGAAVLLPPWPGRSAAAPVAGSPKPPAGVGHPSFLSPHAAPLAVTGGRVFVANTPADTVDVIDAASRKIVARIDVGIDPVSVAARPDGRELWVSNHVSDSVSVIDTDPESPAFLQVVATVQEFDPRTRATRFDEPAGIAFAGNGKAYVALSSENQVAVVDVPTRTIRKRLTITAQDPRAIAVRGDRLYVLPFESNNKTQLSGGRKKDIDGDLVTFDIWNHSVQNNNVLSIGHVTDIVKHPRVPDRDLYVFDTKTDKLVETVDTLGTLLYGLTVDSTGRVFVAQTDARNDANGRAGTKKHGLAELGNRAFLNQITTVRFDGDRAGNPAFIDLEPLPPAHPDPGMALATPYAVEVSADDSTLVVTAAASDKVFTVDVESGEVLGRVEVGAVPRGIALESGPDGKPSQAWVLNAVANSVSLVDVSDPATPRVAETIALADPTHPAFKRGRIVFESARTSSTATFGCASCHPDGHTDQLLWVLQTPIVSGGNQIMPRSTMPLRGLRDTEPFHWDGIPGDPYGGSNSAHVRGRVKPNSTPGVPESATRHLVDGSLATTMLLDGDPTKNDEGKAGMLNSAERDDLARFLLGIPFPPAQKRAYTNVLTDRAEEGFDLFHLKGNHEGKPKPNVCGNCHRMPFWVSTNTPGTGMDAPTWRGAYDRFLILPQGRLNVIDLDFYRGIAGEGIPEEKMWRFSWRSKARFDPVWNMVLEGSTGFSGSFARQLTLNRATARTGQTKDLLGALEVSAAERGVVLNVEGVFLTGGKPRPVKMQFDAVHDGGRYVETTGARRTFARGRLVSMAAEGEFVGTFTGRHGARDDLDHPQPALWTRGPIHSQRGRQEFPVLYGGHRTMTVSGRHVREGAAIIVDGRRVPGLIRTGAKEQLAIELASLPATGMHFLQVQNPDGLFSNDFIFHVAENEEAAKKAREPERVPPLERLEAAIARGDVAETRRLAKAGAPVNARNEDSGGTPLSAAAFHGHPAVARVLLNNGARLARPNRDGNTPLHVAAFLCRTDVIELFLERGASLEARNDRGDTPLDSISGPWSKDLADLYTFLSELGELGLDLDDIRQQRPRVAKALREHLAQK